jgi:formamidopyrimidine-DNA glycosylase
MPELPEVETTLQGIKPHIINQPITAIRVHQKQLRWLVPDKIQQATNIPINKVIRRAKYIIIQLEQQSILIHLGMSGSLRIVDNHSPLKKHDHVEWQFKDKILRLNDPRKFGCVLWTDQNIEAHKLISSLGVEPLCDTLTNDYLFDKSRKKQVAIKQLIMNSKIIVGVGNIYASESLFLAGINPKIQAGKISKKRYVKLTQAIKSILKKAIKEGGTTLKDFSNADGKPGYFQQQLNVYGLNGKPCPSCGKTIKKILQNKRSSFYCSNCQK